MRITNEKLSDLVLKGSLCAICGIYIEEGISANYPRICRKCGGDANNNFKFQFKLNRRNSDDKIR